MTVKMVYVTTPNLEEAKRIARTTVEEKLAGCVNIFPPVISCFCWEGKVAEAEEIVVIFKTTSQCSEKLMNRIQGLHTYECPCIIEYNASQTTPSYQQWLQQECKIL